jgi:nicotinamidase-related amidase
VPIIHVKTGLRASVIDDTKGFPSAWRLTFPVAVGAIPGIDRHGIEDSKWTELLIETAPDDLIVDNKKRLSIFFATDLEFLLRQMRRRAVILTGIMTDCCVLNAAFDAANRDFRVVVPQDLVRGFSSEIEDAALRIVSLHLGLVVDSSALVEGWQRQAIGA